MNRTLFAVALLPALAAPIAAAAVPTAAPGFVVENAIPGSHIEAPVALAFTPDGRLLVADVPGRVWVIQDGVQLPVPMWAHETEVEINGDCGLLGMALDPDFANNRWIYLLYAVDPDTNGVDDDSVHFGRLVRYQVSASNPNRVDESTRTVLLGTGWADGIPNYSGTHSTGALRFGADGTLLVSAGEGARYDMADAGGHSPALFAPGFAPPAWDRGAFRAQQLDCPGGKILRLDPATGRGLPSNPFWDGDPNSVRSKVWAYGMRNPFRFSVWPGTGSPDPAAGDPGTLLVGDVGWQLWEELTLVPSGGLDLGWPCREGPRAAPVYPGLAPTYGGCETMPATAEPVLAFHHQSPDSSIGLALKGNAISAGLFYTHTQFPTAWQGRYVFGDFYRGWIAAERFGPGGAAGSAIQLASNMNGPVDYAIEPSTGWLYVACIIDDTVRRIRWAPSADVGSQPASLALSPPAPNPASHGVRLALTLPRPGRVAFDVLDAAGRLVWSAPAVDRPAGAVTLAWDGRDARGARVAPGLYFARVEALGETLTRRVIAL